MAKKRTAKDGIFEFRPPEEIDKIILDRIASTPKHGGTRNGKWTPAELQLRDDVILDYICHMGFSRAECAKQISDRWQVNISTANRYIKEAFDRLAQDNEQFRVDVREKTIERLEAMLQSLMEKEMYDQALKVQDQINKINGLYLERKDITVNDTNISFKFGE